MKDKDHEVGKSWQQIAEEIAKEPDLNRVAELSTELIEALNGTERPPTSATTEQPALQSPRTKAS